MEGRCQHRTPPHRSGPPKRDVTGTGGPGSSPLAPPWCTHPRAAPSAACTVRSVRRVPPDRVRPVVVRGRPWSSVLLWVSGVVVPAWSSWSGRGRPWFMRRRRRGSAVAVRGLSVCGARARGRARRGRERRNKQSRSPQIRCRRREKARCNYSQICSQTVPERGRRVPSAETRETRPTAFALVSPSLLRLDATRETVLAGQPAPAGLTGNGKALRSQSACIGGVRCWLM
jgi:hypothetical protein